MLSGCLAGGIPGLIPPAVPAAIATALLTPPPLKLVTYEYASLALTCSQRLAHMLASGVLHALKARAREVAPGVAPTIEGALVSWASRGRTGPSSSWAGPVRRGWESICRGRTCCAVCHRCSRPPCGAPP